MSRESKLAELEGMCIVVTGSSSGIGRAISLGLAASGADVIVHCRESLEAAEDVARLIREAGRKATVILADLRDPAACDRLVKEAWKQSGRVDAWVNNAGADVLTPPGNQLSFDEKLRELFAVDVSATIRLSRGVGTRMRQAGGGVILNMGWDQAETGMEGDSGELFSASKSAVMAFSKSLALSLAPEVRVNCLAPGWIRTAWAEGASGQWQERAAREVLLGRWGTPEDVAAVARFLVSPSAGFLTGQIVRVNGGAVR